MRLGPAYLAMGCAMAIAAAATARGQTRDDRYHAEPGPVAPETAVRKDTEGRAARAKDAARPSKAAGAKKPMSGAKAATPSTGTVKPQTRRPEIPPPVARPSAAPGNSPPGGPAPAKENADNAGAASPAVKDARAFDEQFATCLACHGTNGQSETPETPSLSGQPAPFIVVQLRMLREGKRKIPAMEPLALQLSEDNLRRYADTIEKLPMPRPPAGPVDSARYERGKAIASAMRCANCHNMDFSGAGSNPRLAHQREDYLVKALRDYKSAARIDQGALMVASVKDIGDPEFADLAHYLANLR